MCTTLYFYFCVHYSVLTTTNLVSIRHHTVDSFNSFCPLLTTLSPLVTTTVSPLHTNLQVANFQRCERAVTCPIT